MKKKRRVRNTINHDFERLENRLLLDAVWYARSYDGGTSYGSGDGTSYETAWNGLYVNWSVVNPGDTIYICGLHDSRDGAYRLLINKSGAEGSPITIRGDYPGDPGVLMAASAVYTDGWTVYDAPSSIYSRSISGVTNFTSVHAFERHDGDDLVDGIVRLSKPGNADFGTWQPGSYYVDGSTLYYKPTLGVADDYTFYAGNSWENIGIYSEKHDIVISNITLLGAGTSAGAMRMKDGINHVTIDNVTVRWSPLGMRFYPDNSSPLKPSEYITIENCVIRDCRSGIYPYGTANHIQIVNNEVYDLNQEGYYPNADTHAIGLQGGGSDWLIEGNHIHHVDGEGIIIYYDPNWAVEMAFSFCFSERLICF